MAVCYFDDKYEEKYNCLYEVKDNVIEVTVDYNIMDEIPAINGIRSYGSNTEFKKRDILIIDYQSKMSYLLKNAQYWGHSEIIGTPDGGDSTKFVATYYFKNSNYKKLCDISKGCGIEKIRVYSNMINELIGYPSLSRKETEDEYVIELKRKTVKQKLEINKNNVRSLVVSDDWKSVHSRKNNNIDIELSGYIEIEMEKSICYEEVYNYVNELMLFFQLLKPCRFYIEKIVVEINKSFYEFCFQMDEIKYKDSYVQNSVNENVLDFLYKCYTKIPYRDGKSEIRNIPYIILNTSRNLEDNFLMFYRFIECYYKQQPIENIKKTFIEFSIKNNYRNLNKSNEAEIENLVYEIVSLRNHYVHEGYFINNKKLYISFPKIGKMVNTKNHIEENIDWEWIYDRTKILYEIVIDIIFRDMLGYEKYKFYKHF